MNLLLKKLGIFLMLILFASSSFSRKSGKIQLDTKTLTQVNKLLSTSSDFHKALFKQNKGEIKKNLKLLNKNLDNFSSEIGDFQISNQGMHLKKILKSIQGYLESYKNINKEEKRLYYLNKAFEQLVLIVRIYQVEKKFHIYYCKDDNSEWVQEGWKAQNPIHPERHPNCGMRPYH